MQFSIIIPTYNRQATLRRCLLAVTTQDHRDYEVIVVDDASEDGTAEMVKKEFPGVRYLLQEGNQGPAAARNRGIEEAHGEIIAFTDDDCIPPGNWLSEISSGFEAYPQAGAIGGLLEPHQEIWAHNLLARYELYCTRHVYHLGDEVKIAQPAPLGTHNLAVKKEILIQMKGFDENFPVPAGEDADLLHRLAELGHSSVYIPIKVTHNRSYTWPLFIKQHFQRGIGATYFLAKRGSLRSQTRDYLLLFGLPALFWVDAWRSRSLQIAFVSVISRFLQTIGRIRTRPRARSLSSESNHKQCLSRNKRRTVRNK
jgi:glycosyltransferase involved in cell wall biosynthesis